MSNRFHAGRWRRAAIAVGAVLALGLIPAAAQASEVNLGTANPFVVLGGSEVTNTGASVLNGELGVAPGTELTGFNAAVVNGATHDNDPVAAKAQEDLTTAFGVAGSQPISPGNELTGIDLGGLTLTPGAYGYSSSAQLTGQLTLNAQGNPNAQFVFVIGSTLTTASASSVKLINGASPCNVYWRVGSSATLGTTTEFQGNLMALTSITVNNGVHVQGRVLARNAAITLNNDVLDNSQCATSTETETTPPTGGTSPISPTPTPVTPPAGTTKTKKPPIIDKAHGPKVHHPAPTSNGRSSVNHSAAGPNGTTVTVNGKAIKRIVVNVDNHRVKSSAGQSLKMTVNGAPGTHEVTVHVTYKDHTPGKTTTFHFHVPSPAPLHPRHGPSKFTG
jgi:hypothetical protein